MPQYLYRLQPTRIEMLTDGPTERESAVIGAHFAHLQSLVAQGTVLMAGRTLNDDASTFGLVVFAADSDARADALMNDDPAVKHGVMRAELFPYRIALWSPSGPT